MMNLDGAMSILAILILPGGVLVPVEIEEAYPPGA
jgi:hypothetical protein